MGYIEILRPGMGCSVQDKGRYGYMSEGIPVSGAMDQHLAGLANMLVNNTSNEALIEWKLLHEIATHKAISVRKGDILNLKLSRVSGYGYMAVSGGFQSNKVLGSRSFYPKITAYAFLEKGMKLPIVTINKPVSNLFYCREKLFNWKCSKDRNSNYFLQKL